MDAATTDDAALMRRVVRRALTVLGGTAVGTAIIWAASAAFASAETACQDSVLAQVQAQAVERFADTQLVPSLSDVVCTVDQVVPVPSVSGLEHSATRVAGDASRRLTGEVNVIPGVPIRVGDLDRSAGPGAHSSPGRAAHSSPSLARPLGEPSATASSGGHAGQSNMDVLAAHGTAGRTLVGMTHGGSPSSAPGTPPVPGKPAHAPLPAPTSGSPGPIGGGADYPTAATFCSSTGQRDLTSGRVPPTADTGALAKRGTVPGVTPD